MRWSNLGVAYFFVCSVRVHSKCFDPTMQVTMADGSRRALMEVQLGDAVKSWDFETGSPTTSTVADLLKFRRESLMELRLETGDTIYSTDDHPYWSHKKQCLVSRDPISTSSLYKIHASLLEDEEVFVNEDHQPVSGRVSTGRRTASIIMDGVDVPDTMEVMTLGLNGSHWFYVQGILVHNKGGSNDDEGPPKGGLKGGWIPLPHWEEPHGYRRRRGHALDRCYIIDKSHYQCQDNDDWYYPDCKTASQKEYEDNSACYDCPDDDCIQRLCAKNAEVCHPAKRNCTCCGCVVPEPDDEDGTRLLASNDKTEDECLVVDGECAAETTYTSCCSCFVKMQNNVKCDEEPPEPSLLSVVIAIMGGAGVVIYLIWWAVDIIKQKIRGKADTEDLNEINE